MRSTDNDASIDNSNITDFDPYNSDDFFFNPYDDIDVSIAGNLPHWNQPGKIQYVTFRLGDSLPQSKLVQLKELKDKFLKDNPKPWSADIKKEYWKLVGPREDKLLDNGYGECLLRQCAIRKILEGALHYNDGQLYELGAYVIMPNHVHLLIYLFGSNKLEDVMKSIKSYSAHMINKLLHRKGEMWQRESFDRIIRDRVHLRSVIGYIRHNPDYLQSGEYSLKIYWHGI